MHFSLHILLVLILLILSDLPFPNTMPRRYIFCIIIFIVARYLLASDRFLINNEIRKSLKFSPSIYHTFIEIISMILTVLLYIYGFNYFQHYLGEGFTPLLFIALLLLSQITFPFPLYFEKNNLRGSTKEEVFP